MVYVHLATGFEEVEAITVVDILRRADIEVRSVSVTEKKLVMGAHGINVEADILFVDADYSICEMIVLPGGMPGATNLEAHEGLMRNIREFAVGDKKIAAICAAPLALGTAGVIEGRRATIYPGMEDRLAGAVPTGEAVTVDGNIITGKGPAFAMEFALTIVEEIKGTTIREKVATKLLL
ncbi:MAG: DJ-1/PfpI family protein [Eubacteriales bacterium]|nr:DJ-1/PfpI family protein [Eubacteriales bacterium]